MAYIKQTWIDGTSIANEDTMNHIENGIYNNSLDIENNNIDIANNTYSIDNLNGTLLWTNSNSTSNFVAQTISLDLTDYDYVEIWYNQVKDTGISSIKIKKNTGQIRMLSFKYLSGNYGGDCILTRGASVADTGITFTMAHALGIGANSASTQYDESIIPIYIVGYKTPIFDS